MKTSELRNLGSDELQDKVKSLKKEVFEMNFQRASGRVEKPGRFKGIRRDIARIMTILNERQKEENNGKSE